MDRVGLGYAVGEFTSRGKSVSYQASPKTYLRPIPFGAALRIIFRSHLYLYRLMHDAYPIVVYAFQFIVIEITMAWLILKTVATSRHGITLCIDEYRVDPSV